MRYRVLVVVGAAAAWGAWSLPAAASGGAVLAVKATAPAVAPWGRVIDVPGLGALDKGKYTIVESVSCGSKGDCAAGGFYHDRAHHQQGFVVTERNGRWGRAIGVPGLSALNRGGFAGVGSVSCRSAGSCAAGGIYNDRYHNGQAFVTTERDGRWGRAIEVPGLAALNAGGNARVWSVSCGAPGNCVAGGNYADRSTSRAFVVTERGGRWGQAMPVPGLTALNPAAASRVASVSCASAGNCAAVGSDQGQGFAVSERNGQWGQAILIPGLQALKGERAHPVSVSCGSPGNCAAGGHYTVKGSGEGKQDGFLTIERNGRWSPMAKVPGRGAFLTKGQYYAAVTSVSCTPAGPCTAGGAFIGRNTGGFVISEKNGRWGKLIKIPAAVPSANGSSIYAVSCPAPGHCVAGGAYQDKHFADDAVVISEKNGRWTRVIQVPGLRALTSVQYNTIVYSVSCATPGSCTAVGIGGPQAFVTQDGARRSG